MGIGRRICDKLGIKTEIFKPKGYNVDPDDITLAVSKLLDIKFIK